MIARNYRVRWTVTIGGYTQEMVVSTATLRTMLLDAEMGHLVIHWVKAE